jgi:hypothetical protein
MSPHDVSQPGDVEQRLRAAFQAVAELPGAVPGAVTATAAGDHGPRHIRLRRQPRLVIAMVSVAALALAVALALTFGPHSSAPPGPHGQGPGRAPASHSHTTTTPPTNPSPPLGFGTEQITYEPFTGATLKPDWHVSARDSGTCFQYGGGAQGRYLYRCGTMQPCVAGSLGPDAPLACLLGAPAANDVVLWTATSVDTTGFTPATTKTPFAMQLSDGTICELVNAAWSGLGPFGCDGFPGAGGSPATTPADCRQPVAATTTPYWTTQCQDQLAQSSPFTSTTVVRVWF